MNASKCCTVSWHGLRPLRWCLIAVDSTLTFCFTQPNLLELPCGTHKRRLVLLYISKGRVSRPLCSLNLTAPTAFHNDGAVSLVGWFGMFTISRIQTNQSLVQKPVSRNSCGRLAQSRKILWYFPFSLHLNRIDGCWQSTCLSLFHLLFITWT